jgi:hypothetical protein
MARIDRQKWLDKSRYSLYGRWFLYVCSVLGVDQKEIARRADLDAGAISKQLIGTHEPKRESVKRTIAAMRTIASEKNTTWDGAWDDLIMTGAGLATDSEIALSEARLDAIGGERS